MCLELHRSARSGGCAVAFSLGCVVLGHVRFGHAGETRHAGPASLKGPETRLVLNQA